MKSSDIRRVDAEARKNFLYEVDPPEVIDQWRSFAREVRAAEKWIGDCDDLTSTVLHLLSIDGMDHADMWRALVSSDRSGLIDHMIGICLDDEGRRWIVGDTSAPMYPYSQHEYKIVKTSRVSEGTVWRRPSF